MFIYNGIIHIPSFSRNHVKMFYSMKKCLCPMRKDRFHNSGNPYLSFAFPRAKLQSQRYKINF